MDGMNYSNVIPHLHVFLDLKWIGVRAGLMYYEINTDAYRPAFVEFHLFGKWRIAFEAGKINRMENWR